ncbi:MAG: PQQ-binding-like beta-propeller repeat protein [Bacteroidales bacterium]|nr:PQQ-binding-like beta-propeller repeat protein [Bacteroidales bacterium]
MTVWESLLDSMAIIKPELVVNHTTSEKEIFVQDASNSVCLLNSTGRILWQVKTESPIMGEIYQVDYYANGKLQYLFSTSKKIYLLDRNGNNVERYPVKLRSSATNGIALFDYDNRKEYRMFVACEDRKVYAYDLDGNILPGWNFRKSEGEVKQAIQHFRINEKDYILFSDPVRTYILDRRGKERVKIKQQEAFSLNNDFYLDMNVAENSPRFVSTDTSGNILGINLSGEVEMLLEHKAGSGHFFRTKDLNQDGNKEYIFADENHLEVIDIKGERLFSFKIKNDISTLPDIYEFSSADLKIGITDAERNLIYLLNSDGTLYEGFPLEGNTRYTIGYFAGSDSRFNLIVGSQNGFLYNYSIE